MIVTVTGTETGDDGFMLMLIEVGVVVVICAVVVGLLLLVKMNQVKRALAERKG
ncbi:MAG: hypothetical protein RBG13Loki_4187 [Promethearchaeota archaeon CR_4]|nr:MAG: hypothetical protein RBG13Loki_4187 [Candidatus Lokiarchaeota archaeon CR_4]